MTGFIEPNYTQTPNELFDTHMATMGEAELRVTLAVVRKTMGYHKDSDAISWSQIMKMTGLSRTSTQDGIDKAIEHGFIEIVGNGKRGVNIFKMVVKPNQSTNTTGTGSEGLPMTGSEGLPTKETEKKSAKEIRAKAQRTPKPIRFPDDTYKYTSKHIDAYQKLHSTNINLLIQAWYANPMLITLKDIPLSDAKKCVATHQELERAEICPPDYPALIKQTRESKALAWKLTKGGISITDVQSEILTFKSVKPVVVSGETYGERAIQQGRAMFFGGNERGGSDGNE